MTKQEIKNNINTIIETAEDLKIEGYTQREILEITHKILLDLIKEI